MAVRRDEPNKTLWLDGPDDLPVNVPPGWSAIIPAPDGLDPETVGLEWRPTKPRLIDRLLKLFGLRLRRVARMERR